MAVRWGCDGAHAEPVWFRHGIMRHLRQGRGLLCGGLTFVVWVWYNDGPDEEPGKQISNR